MLYNLTEERESLWPWKCWHVVRQRCMGSCFAAHVMLLKSEHDLCCLQLLSTANIYIYIYANAKRGIYIYIYIDHHPQQAPTTLISIPYLVEWIVYCECYTFLFLFCRRSVK